MVPVRFLAVLGGCLSLGAADLPKLPETALFRTIAQGCRDVPLAGWHHPVRAALDRPGVRLTRVALCNDNRYPILYVDLRYDPMGQTDAFFGPLYAAVADANGYWPFALVSLHDDEIVEVATSRPQHTITLSYETFAE